MTSKNEEIILAVERSKLFEAERLTFEGGITGEASDEIFENIATHYIRGQRGELEKNPLFKQPIPYVVITRGDEVFVYERLSEGGEQRLHGKLSLGAGGHMNPIEDAKNFRELFEENMNRELEEELEISNQEHQIQILGLINDDTDSVGQVHIGILGQLEVQPGTQVSVKETNKLRGLWMTREELTKEHNWERLENWSQIAFQNIG